MRLRILVPAFLFIIATADAQDYYEQFKKHFSAEDTLAQIALLRQWEKTNGNDPELYTCYFNYYVQKGKASGIRLGKTPGKGENYSFSDSSGNVAGYIYGETNYDPKYLNAGFAMIDKGIKKFPDRLDMRFGKIHMLGELDDYNAFSDEIVNAIKYAAENKNQWKWTQNKSVDGDPKEFFFGNLQTYVNRLFDW